MSPLPVDDAVARWVAKTCRAQGLPEKITDPAVLGQIGVLLGARTGKPRAHGAPAPSTRIPAAPSQPPLGLHPVRI
ncbi:hypothetical protein J4G33_13200 [Actinotalea sp. BY-33]|uniref:Uncharacterized protein n=1 Tax=Actinotalea soli TaxID=2819234 RepID=A0A939LRZ3_9CELL|nr:hypothetical protein [Actinotalea soli]MBO1752763.1 hypothetical protein [Actinotalea soli]